MARVRVAPMKTNSLPLLARLALLATMLFGGRGCASSVDSDEEESTEASSDALLRQSALGAKGDSCSFGLPDGTTVPGTEDDVGQCCRNADPTDCVVILKPF